MAPETSLMDLVLAELKAIRESIADLRDEVHGQLGRHATQLATISQWVATHEAWEGDVRRRIEVLQKDRNEQRGATIAFRWVVAMAMAGLGLLEAWLHGSHK